MTHVALLPGGNCQPMILNMSNGQWTHLPSFLGNLRYEYHAGMVNFVNGTQAIVMFGGKARSIVSYTEIFSMETMQWQPGPDPPNSFLLRDVVQLKDTFLVSMDSTVSSSQDKIGFFNPSTANWDEWNVNLNVNRLGYRGVLIPDGIINCN